MMRIAEPDGPVIDVLRELARRDPQVIWGVLNLREDRGTLQSYDAYCEWPERDVYCEIHYTVGYGKVRVLLDTFTIDSVPVDSLLPLLSGISQGTVEHTKGRFGGKRVVVRGVDGQMWTGL